MTLAASAFDDLLSSLHVGGQVLLVDEYRPPWAIDIPDGVELAQRLGQPSGAQLIPFHIVRRGAFELHMDGCVPRVIHAGEAAICIGSLSHRMIEGRPDEVVAFAELLDDPVHPIRTGQTGSTELVCGVFVLSNAERSPLVDALPDVLQADLTGRQGSKAMELLTQMLVSELQMNRTGCDYMATRLVELLFAEAIRQHLDNDDHPDPGWFRAMRDPKIGAAINAIHASPKAALSVASLAERANLSPSRFAARFRQLLGKSVMAYVAQWRMSVARRLLIETDLPIAQVAYESGYDNTAAFSRAFSNNFGVPPGSYRRSQTPFP